MYFYSEPPGPSFLRAAAAAVVLRRERAAPPKMDTTKLPGRASSLINSSKATCPHLRAMRRRPDQRLELLTLVNASTSFFLPGAASPADDDTHCCLHCTFRGLRSPNAREIQRHHIAAGHFLAVGLARGLLWCAKCGDYVYDELFEEAWRLRALDASADGEMRCLPIVDDTCQLGRPRRFLPETFSCLDRTRQ